MKDPMTKHLPILAVGPLLALWSLAPLARAGIFKWEYINPADPNQGKRQSTTLVPDGAGVDAVPFAYLAGRNLTMAHLIGADLGSYSDEYGFYYETDMTGANLSQADLTEANLTRTLLTGVNLTGAEVRWANFFFDPEYGLGTGITTAQLYSTASYQAHDLTGIELPSHDLTGVNLANQNLTDTNFFSAALTNADFSRANLTNAIVNFAAVTGSNLTDAEVRGASFYRDDTNYPGSGISISQLQSTASYQAHDLTGIRLQNNMLSGANLAGQNLTDADFSGATLSAANLSGAIVRGANFVNTGVTAAQIYATASYQAHDLAGIDLRGSNFDGGDLANQSLADANFSYATLTNANLSHANLTNTSFYLGTLTGANLNGANLGNAYFHSATLSSANLSAADARRANFSDATLTGANTTNLIHSDGHIAGLDLMAGASLVVRDYDGNPAVFPATGPLPVVVEERLTMDATGTLRLVFDADPWDSTISFAPGIPVARGGTLDLTFAPGMNVAVQTGRTIDLFNWTGVNPAGAFTVSSPYVWDLTNLYTTGEVTLLATADFNGNFHVNGTDLAVWSANFGLANGAAPNQGDANRDLRVDGADFLAWQQQFGAGSLQVAAGAAVPEPAAVLLVLTALVPTPRRAAR
jgi:uncharacterized protein YjbI with pentapeptide repeats